MCRVVLMKDAVSNCLVDLLNGESVRFGGGFLIARRNREIVLLDNGLELSLQHTVTKWLRIADKDTLLCRLDVSRFLLLIYYKAIRGTHPYRLRGSDAKAPRDSFLSYAVYSITCFS